MNMKTSTIFLLLLALLSMPAISEETEEPRPESELEEWRSTLLYGINQELTDLLPQLTTQSVAQLKDDVLHVFSTSPDTSVQKECLTYFTKIESAIAKTHSIELLSDYDVLDPVLTRAIFDYLQTLELDLSRQERALFQEIVSQNRIVEIVPPAIRLLAATGESPDFFIDLYREEDLGEPVRAEILLALGELGDPSAYDFVQELLDPDQDATTMIERYAIDTLGRLGDRRAIPVIIRQLDASDAMTRAYAVSALKNFSGPEIDEAIVAALRDDFWRVRIAALQTVAERSITTAVPAVIYKMRRDPEEKVRLEAAATLAVLNASEGWEAIRERAATTRTPEIERGALLEHMAKHDVAACTEIMLSIADAEWERESSRLLDSVGRIISTNPDPGFEPLYIRFLLHRNFILQIYAIRGIGGAGIQSLKSDVQLRTEESYHRAVRSAALRAIEQL